MGNELMSRPAINSQGIVKSLVALDEFFDGGRGTAIYAGDPDSRLQFARIVNLVSTRGASRITRLQNQRKTDLLGERPYRIGTFRTGRLGARNAGFP